jgi:hypothetical protein
VLDERHAHILAFMFDYGALLRENLTLHPVMPISTFPVNRVVSLLGSGRRSQPDTLVYLFRVRPELQRRPFLPVNASTPSGTNRVCLNCAGSFAIHSGSGPFVRPSYGFFADPSQI